MEGKNVFTRGRETSANMHILHRSRNPQVNFASTSKQVKQRTNQLFSLSGSTANEYNRQFLSPGQVLLKHPPTQAHGSSLFYWQHRRPNVRQHAIVREANALYPASEQLQEGGSVGDYVIRRPCDCRLLVNKRGGQEETGKAAASHQDLR